MIEITDFRETDIDDVCRIADDSFSVPWSKQSFFDVMSNSNALFLTAKNDGKVAGYVCIYFAADEGELADIATDTHFRRCGIASLLLGRAIDFSCEKGIKSLFLEVRKSNVAAIALYEKFGFVKIGERRAYYTHPTEDACIMKLNLQKGSFYAYTRT